MDDPRAHPGRAERAGHPSSLVLPCWHEDYRTRPRLKKWLPRARQGPPPRRRRRWLRPPGRSRVVARGRWRTAGEASTGRGLVVVRLGGRKNLRPHENKGSIRWIPPGPAAAGQGQEKSSKRRVNPGRVYAGPGRGAVGAVAAAGPRGRALLAAAGRGIRTCAGGGDRGGVAPPAPCPSPDRPPRLVGGCCSLS